MTTDVSAQAPDAGVPAPIALLDLIMGSMVTQALHVAAKLDVAGLLVDGPLSADEIARGAGSHPDATYRLLRLLTSYGVFAEEDGRRFRLTPMADALRADAPMTMRGMALLLGHPLQWEDWGHLATAIETGEPVLPKLRGMGGYEFLAANPEFGAVFEGGMGNLSALETEPLLAAYDFTPYNTIVDVFGGKGTLLAGILQRAPHAKGILADQRAEHLGAAEFLAAEGVADRSSIDTRGLFDPPPAGADAYLMKHIVHEWPEEQALQLLRNVRSVIRDDGRLFLMEFVIPEGPQRHAGKLVDLWLMILMGGKERTATEYAALLGRAGFRLEKVVDTVAGVSIVVAEPV